MQDDKNKPFLVMRNNEIHTHPEFRIVFDFLIQIEAEITELMSYQDRLKSIKNQCSELLKLMGKLTVPDDLNFKMSENPETLTEKFRYIRPVRSELIVLFAHLETLRCLYTAYENNTSDNRELRDASEGAMEKFINEFCLSEKNQWIQNNPKRSGKLSARNLCKLRNSLTHFFSVDKIGIVPIYDEETEKIGNKINNKVQLISSEDFAEILHHTGKLVLKKWCQDCEDSLSGQNNNFVEKMRRVKEVVERNAARFLIQNKIP